MTPRRAEIKDEKELPLNSTTTVLRMSRGNTMFLIMTTQTIARPIRLDSSTGTGTIIIVIWNGVRVGGCTAPCQGGQDGWDDGEED